MANRSKLCMRLELSDARLKRVGPRPTLAAAGGQRWRSLVAGARRRKRWAVGALSTVIAAELAALLIAAGGVPVVARGSRMGPLDASAEELGGSLVIEPHPGRLRLLGEPMPAVARWLHELPAGVVSSVPELLDWHERVPWGLPVSLERGWVSSEFSMRRVHPVSGEPRPHYGIDLAVDEGVPIRATAKGVVTFAGDKGGYGLIVFVDHENGVVTRYAHCSKLLVRVGEQVVRGEKIALAGKTGVVTGEHLHYEVRLSGTPVNPRAYLPDGLPDKRPPGM